jgi:hypothetical protein
MAKTLDDLQNLLTRQGYTCELLLDTIVATRVQTKTYKNPAGEHALEIYVTFDKPNRCVAVESLHAFDLRATNHREAALACLLTANGRTPLVRPALEPEGDIRIRVDCPCDDDGARDERVLEALAVLTGFVEAWHPQVTKAMKTGKFNAGDVAHLNLSRIPLQQPAAPSQGDQPEEPGKPTQPDEPAGGPSIGSVMRAAAISTKPGGHPARLTVLKAFRDWLDEQRGRNEDPNGDHDGDHDGDKDDDQADDETDDQDCDLN